MRCAALVFVGIGLMGSGCATLTQQPASYVDESMKASDGQAGAPVVVQWLAKELPVGPTLVYVEPSGSEGEGVGKAIADGLRARGYAIATATEGVEAEKLTRVQYSLSPLDRATVLLRFGTASGGQAAQVLRRGEDGQLVPIGPLTVRKDGQ